MKLISSIVRPERVDTIKTELAKIHVTGMTVAEVRDHGPHSCETTVWRGREYNLGYSIKMAIEFVVHDEDVDEVVKVLIKTARTGRDGDGHVSVLPIEHRYNIRSGERDLF